MALMDEATKQRWIDEHGLLQQLVALEETEWFNPKVVTASTGLPKVGLSADDVAEASARLKRFAPYLAEVFADTRAQAGVVESPLQAVSALQEGLASHYGQALPGQLWLKCDSHLPISGSIKARGGIYEVLKQAETLALASGKLNLGDDYRCLNSDQWRAFFGQYSIAVGSTGNLGLSIGIMSAQLGFKVSVHMSADARQWKKDRLRAHGVNVVEYAADYSKAVEMGRAEADSNPFCHFVDDEHSTDLFLGYAVAAERLAGQLQAMAVTVDAEHPLFVYLPCGVGGGPGGIAFGLKQLFGDHVHCVFAEPTHAPCMLLGVYTDLHEQISVQDLGIDQTTVADGLAVGRASGFVGRAMGPLLAGYYTIADDELFRLIALANACEGVEMEPSAAAGVAGMARVLKNSDYLARLGYGQEQLAQATHIAWVTGGSMVPAAEMQAYLAQGRALLA